MKTAQFLLVISLLLSALKPSSHAVEMSWVQRYDGVTSEEDAPSSMAIDNSGNLYVTGRSNSSASSDDIATIKYSPGGAVVWTKLYQGSEASVDRGYDIAVDENENVYITGMTGTYGLYDYVTIKYDINGDTAWVRTYNGPDNREDWGIAISVDTDGSVYVTGRSSRYATSEDFVTIKYDQSGNVIWTRTYNGPGNGEDHPTAIAIDRLHNVFVIGDSDGGYENDDFVTIKYSSNGDISWIKRYDGPVAKEDVPYAIVTDDSLNAYITGFSPGADYSGDILTIKYRPNGDTAWIRRYNDPFGGSDVGTCIGIDLWHNVIVAGGTYASGSTYDCSRDFITIKFDSSGSQLWLRTYNGIGNCADQITCLKLGGEGSVYVSGGSYRTSNYDDFSQDFQTIKYLSNGDEDWSIRYDGPANAWDIPVAMVLDNEGNVFIAGPSDGIGPIGNQSDYATIKYRQFTCGDANDNSSVNILDVTFLINYLYKSGPPPNHSQACDVNNSGGVNILDVTFLINFLYKSGPTPNCP